MIHDTQTLLRSLSAFCTARRVTAWLVGGSVRDLALGRHPHDFDLAVDTDGVALARDFADLTGGSFVELDSERGTGRIIYQHVPAPETHSDNAPERYSLDIVQLRAPTLHEDLALRDFTINAMAIPLAHRVFDVESGMLQIVYEHVIDPYGGLHDCTTRTIHLCRPTSFHDDPLRLLRAIRLAASLGLHIGPETEHALKHDAPRLENVAAERIRDELMKLLALPAAATWLAYLDDRTLLTRIFPELEPSRGCDQPGRHFLPVLEHQIETVACIEWLLARVLHDADNNPHSTHTQTQERPPDRMRVSLPIAVQTYPDIPFALPYTDRLREHFSSIMRSGYPRRALLKLAALLHDNAKPHTKQSKPNGGVSFYGHQKIGAKTAFCIAQRLRLSRRDARYVENVVRNHMRPGHLRQLPDATPRAIARFLRDTGEGDIAAAPDVVLHDLADTLAASGPALDLDSWGAQRAWAGALLHMLWGKSPEQTHPLVNGHELMTLFGIEPGKLVGMMLHEIQEAQAAGEISSRDEALARAKKVFDTYSSSVSVVTHP